MEDDNKKFFPPNYEHAPKRVRLIVPTQEEEIPEVELEVESGQKKGLSRRVSIAAIVLSLLVIGVLLWVSVVQKGQIILIVEGEQRYTDNELFTMTGLDPVGVYTFDDIPYIISGMQSVPGVVQVDAKQVIGGDIIVSLLFADPVAMVVQGEEYVFIDKSGNLFPEFVPQDRIEEYPLFFGLNSWKGSDYEIRRLLIDLERLYQEFPELQSEVSEVLFDGVTSNGDYRAILYPIRYPVEVVISEGVSGEALRKGWELMVALQAQGTLEDYTTFGITEKGVMYRKKEIAQDE